MGLFSVPVRDASWAPPGLFLDKSLRANLTGALEDEPSLSLILVMDCAAEERAERIEKLDCDLLSDGGWLDLREPLSWAWAGLGCDWQYEAAESGVWPEPYEDGPGDGGLRSAQGQSMVL